MGRRRGSRRRLAGKIVGCSGTQVFDLRVVDCHFSRFPESASRTAQAHDDAFHAHQRFRIERGRPEDIHAVHDQRAQPSYPKAIHPHVTPDHLFQTSLNPRHGTPVPQPTADGHQDEAG
jgi:hypothetical protein